MSERFRAAGYVRVSTGAQAKGESLNAQRDKVRKRIEYEEWEEVNIFEDAGRSGREGKNRPGLTDLLDSLGGIDRLVIPRLDRLGRSASDLFAVYKQLDAADVALVSLGEQFDTSSSTGKMVRTMLSALAEMESDRIRERLEDFNQRKVDEGRYNGGPRPYGYRFEDKRLVIEESEAETIRRIFTEFKGGDSMYEIANRLNDEEVPTARMNGVWDVKKGRWSSQRISERIASVIYRGDLGSRLHDDVRPGTHDEIVSRALWDDCDRRRQGQKSQSGGGRGRTPTEALLPRGFVRCLHCGYSMAAARSTQGYRCMGRDELRNGCEMRESVPREKVDSALRDYFLTYVFDPDASRAEFDAEKERVLNEARASAEREEAAARTAALRRSNIKTEFQDGDMPYTVYAEMDASLIEQEEKATAAAIRYRRASEALTAPDDARFEAWSALRERALGDLTIESDRKALRAVLQRVFDHVAIGKIGQPGAPDETGPGFEEEYNPDDLPAFEHKGTEYIIWLDVRPDTGGWEDWNPADPDGPRDEWGDDAGPPEPSPRLGPQGLPMPQDASAENARMGRALRTSARIGTSPRPSRLGGRASSRTTCGWGSRSSAASSMVTTRSTAPMNPPRALSVVVLPEPVPPQTRMLQRLRTAPARNSSRGVVSVPAATSSSPVKPRRRKRRIVSAGPSTASGGMTTLTREPSGSRASASGDASSTRRPAGASTRSITSRSCASVAKAMAVASRRPARSTHTSARPLTMISSTVGSSSSGCSGPRPSARSVTRRVSSARVSPSSRPASRSTSAAIRSAGADTSSSAPSSNRSRRREARRSRGAEAPSLEPSLAEAGPRARSGAEAPSLEPSLAEAGPRARS